MQTQEKKSLRRSSITTTTTAACTLLGGGLMNTCCILRNKHAWWQNPFILDTIILDRQMTTPVEPSKPDMVDLAQATTSRWMNLSPSNRAPIWWINIALFLAAWGERVAESNTKRLDSSLARRVWSECLHLRTNLGLNVGATMLIFWTRQNSIGITSNPSLSYFQLAYKYGLIYALAPPIHGKVWRWWNKPGHPSMLILQFACNIGHKWLKTKGFIANQLAQLLNEAYTTGCISWCHEFFVSVVDTYPAGLDELYNWRRLLISQGDLTQ